MGINEEKAQLAAKLEEIQAEAVRVNRRLMKLDKVQDLDEPEVGTVLRFSRSLAGSTTKYTFVAYRVWSRLASSKGWYVAGKKNTLNLLGLIETSNSWDDLLVAIGDAPVEVATRWSDPKSKTTEDEPVHLYYQGYASNKIFRMDPHNPQKSVDVKDGRSHTRWRKSAMTSGAYLVKNPGSYRLISKDEAGE